MMAATNRHDGREVAVKFIAKSKIPRFGWGIDEFGKEEAFSAVESVKAAADVYMPVSGKIVEVNEALLDEPALINEDPYENWIVKIEITDKSELDELMTSEEYEKFLAEEE